MSVYLFIFILLLALESVYFRIADKFNIIDKPNQRSSHTRIVLRGGGIIFTIALWIWSIWYGFEYPWLLAGVTLAAGVSFVDDIHSLPDSLRLVVQFVAMFLVFQEVGLLTVVDGGSWLIQGLIVLAALIVCVGGTNIYNFMDGINGMLAAYSFVVVGTFAYLNFFVEQFLEPELMVTVLISILVFGFFNFRTKARCFSGDVGSITMGLIILFLLVRYVQSIPGGGYNVSRLCLIIVFLADGGLTIAKRFLSGRNILAAHREHAYETMVNDLKVPHLYVSTGYALLQLFINVGYIMVADKNLYTLVVALLLVVAYGLFFFFGNRSGKINPIQ